MVSELFVNGGLMRGFALHGNLDGATFLSEERTAPIYRLYSIGDAHPGMFEVGEGGVSVKGELYLVPSPTSNKATICPAPHQRKALVASSWLTVIPSTSR